MCLRLVAAEEKCEKAEQEQCEQQVFYIDDVPNSSQRQRNYLEETVAVFLLNGGCLPIWLTSSPSQSLSTKSQTVTPGRTSRSFRVARPIFSAKGVSADEAKQTFIPGYFSPAACSWSATIDPGCIEILLRPE
mmetsp:Transcript_11701/g.29635  ORF Transcript_11701/g.29635 Transcript_11701/m.29635 type:complete len:133 (+) Transcript_11701:353-751(+)